MLRSLTKLPLVLLCLLSSQAGADPANPSDLTWPLQVYEEAAAAELPSVPYPYHPLEKAERPWRFCILYPHLKDSYWLSVNYGMAEEARRLGVGFTLHEAGGYPNLSRQIDQAESCRSGGYDAVIVGTVSYDGLTPTLAEIAKEMPVIAAVNAIAPEGISASASVPWESMGAAAGKVLATRHPRGSDSVDVAWFPGPQGAGWTVFTDLGFRAALAESSARIVTVHHGDSGREEQSLLIEDMLDSFPTVDYIVGSGPTAEAAISILRARGRQDIGIISDYMTHAVHRGILRERILAAPSDFPVMQGRLAIELAVRAVEGKLELRHVGPIIKTVTPENIDRYGVVDTLAPSGFAPVFSVDP